MTRHTTPLTAKGIMTHGSLLAALLSCACTADLGGTETEAREEDSANGEEAPLTGTDKILDEALGGDGKDPLHAFRSGALRLSHHQWARAVQDLLHLDTESELANDFTADPTSRFDTSILERGVQATLRSDYERAAETLAAQVSANRPVLMGLLPPGTSETSVDISRELTTHFARLAYRRTPTAAQTAALQALFDSASQAADPIGEGSALVLRALLQSPFFLYRFELDGEVEGSTLKLSSLELASKLSFTLWNSIPSEALLDAGESGELADSDTLGTWAESMLQDPKANEVIERLHTQLFRVNYLQNVTKNAELFPTFAADAAPALREQARMFFRDVTTEQDGGIGELLTSTTAYVNNLTAALYGVTAPGDAPIRIDVTQPGRLGYLTQVPYLAKNAGLSTTDPIHRGLFVVQELLCLDLPPPPNNVPPLPPALPDQTTRERYDSHTGPGTCGAGCHVIINAPGFAMEGFDAIGQVRAIDAGKPVDTASTLPLGSGDVVFADAVDLMTQLAETGELHACYARRVAEYVLGREPTDEELPFLLPVASASFNERSAREVLRAVVQNPLFLNRSVQEVLP